MSSFKNKKFSNIVFIITFLVLTSTLIIISIVTNSNILVAIVTSIIISLIVSYVSLYFLKKTSTSTKYKYKQYNRWQRIYRGYCIYRMCRYSYVYKKESE
ncbi:MAG TPA: hypothetical protein EYG73_11535 [Arcobacter sp.]|nr:hypothetical protein [Arcobacter sp.]